MLAVVIPYYKLTFFEKTLQSLARQTDLRFTVYIGDDASPEDCRGLVAKFERKFDFKYFRFESNLGGTSLTQQWDRCISLTNDQKWFMILGDDDILGDNCVELFYANLPQIEAAGSNVVRFASEVIDGNDRAFTQIYSHPELESAADFYCRKAANATRSSLSEYIFSTSAYQRYGFANYPLAWHSDDKAVIDFAENGQIYSINNAVVSVRFSEVNISGRSDNKEQKLAANFQFFSDILKPSQTKFGKDQILFLLLAFEKIIKKERKLKFGEWKMLFRNYIRYFRMVPFLKLIRRFLIRFF